MFKISASASTPISNDNDNHNHSTAIHRNPKINNNDIITATTTTTPTKITKTTTKKTLKREIILLLKLTLPTAVAYLLTKAVRIVVVILAGHYLSTTDLDAIALGFTMTNITGYSMMVGISAVMDTMCPRAYGVGRWRFYSLTTWRAIHVCCLYMVPISVVWLSMYVILVNTGQNPAVALKVQLFCKINILRLPAFMILTISRRFLTCQNIGNPVMYVSALSYLGVFPVLLLLIFYWHVVDTNFVNISWLIVVAYYVYCVIIGVYICVLKPHHPASFQWHSLKEIWSWNSELVRARVGERVGDVDGDGDGDRNAVNTSLINTDKSKFDHGGVDEDEYGGSPPPPRARARARALFFGEDIKGGMKEYLVLGFATTISLCAEWWSWEVMVFLIGLLGKIELAANVIFITTAPIAYMTPLALGLTSATRIGKLIAENEYALAKQISQITLLLVSLNCFCVGVIVFLLKNQLSFMILSDNTSSDPSNLRIIAVVQSVVPLFCVFVFVDGVQGTFQGVLRGMKLQKQTAFAVIFGPWTITIPLACFLGFYLHYGLYGFWVASNVGYFSMVIGFLFIYQRFEWSASASAVYDKYGKEQNENQNIKMALLSSTAAMTKTNNGNATMTTKLRFFHSNNNRGRFSSFSANVSHFSAFLRTQ